MQKRYFYLLFTLLIIISVSLPLDATSLNKIKIDEYNDLEIDYASLVNLFEYPENISLSISPNILEDSFYYPFLDDYIFNDTDPELYLDNYSFGGILEYSLVDVYLMKDILNSNNANEISKECLPIIDYYEKNQITSKESLFLRTSESLSKQGFNYSCIDYLVLNKYIFPKNILLKVSYKTNIFNENGSFKTNLSSKFLENHLFSKGKRDTSINVDHLKYDFINKRPMITVYNKEDNFFVTSDKIEYISINTNKTNTSISKITIKAGIGDLLSKDDFIVSEFDLIINISSSNNEITYNLDPLSQEHLDNISKNINLFLITNKDILINVNDSYFGISEEYGILKENHLGEYFFNIEPSKVVVFNKNQITTIEDILLLKDLDLTSILIGLDKLYALLSSQKDSYFAYNYVSKFIEKNYIDFEQSVILSKFMIYNLQNTIVNYFYDKDTFQKDLFIKDSLEIINKNIFLKKSTESIILDYFLKSDVDLDMLLYQAYKETTYDPDYLKQLYFSLIEDIVYLDKIYSKYGLVLDINSQINNLDLFEKGYIALITLEDTEVNLERINNIKNLQEKDTVYTLRNPYNFSTKKLNFTEMLTKYYLSENRFTEALALTDHIDFCYTKYLEDNNLNYHIDKMVISIPEKEESLVSKQIKDLYDKINFQRRIISSQGFNKIQVDLFSQKEVLTVAQDIRKGYSERISDVYSYTQSSVFEPVKLIGDITLNESGLITLTALTSPTVNFISIYDVIKGHENISDKTNILSQENKIYSQGVYALSTLNSRGIGWMEVEEWFVNPETLRENITLKILLYENDITKKVEIDSSDEKEIPKDLQGDKKVIYMDGKRYSIAYQDFLVVDDFLESLREDAKQTYFNSPYSKDIAILFNKQKLDFDIITYRLSSPKMGLDIDYQKRTFEYLAEIDGYKINDTQRIIDFVNYGTSPLSLAILATTGYYTGNIISSSTGLLGSLISVGESIVIDAAVGSILVYGFDVDTENNNKAVIATNLGVSVFLGISKGIVKKTNSQISKNILSNIEKKAIKNSIKSEMVSNDIDSIKSIYHFKKEMDLKGSKVSYALAKDSYDVGIKITAINNQKVDTFTTFFKGQKDGIVISELNDIHREAIVIVRVIGDDGKAYNVPYRLSSLIESNDKLIKETILNDKSLSNVDILINDELYPAKINKFHNKNILEKDMLEIIVTKEDMSTFTIDISYDQLIDNVRHYDLSLNSLYYNIFKNGKEINVISELNLYGKNKSFLRPLDESVFKKLNDSDFDNLQSGTIFFLDNGDRIVLKDIFYNNGIIKSRISDGTISDNGFSNIVKLNNLDDFSCFVEIIGKDGVVENKNLTLKYFYNNKHRLSYSLETSNSAKYDLFNDSKVYLNDQKEIYNNLNVLKEGDTIYLKNGNVLVVNSVNNDVVDFSKFVNTEFDSSVKINRNDLYGMVNSFSVIEKKIIPSKVTVSDIKITSVAKPRIENLAELDKRIAQLKKLIPESNNYTVEEITKLAHSTRNMDDFVFDKLYNGGVKLSIVPQEHQIFFRGLDVDKKVLGTFDFDTKSIYISKDYLDSPAIVHEIGHYIDFYEVPEYLKYNKYDYFSLNKMVLSISDYSRISPEEFFAEATSMWHGYVAENTIAFKYIGKEQSQLILKEINPDMYNLMKEVYGYGKDYSSVAEIKSFAKVKGITISKITEDKLKILIAGTGIMGVGSHVTVLNEGS